MKNIKKKGTNKKILQVIIDILLISVIIFLGFYGTLTYTKLEKYFPQNLLNANKVILIENTKELKIVYVDSNKDKIELNYNIEVDKNHNEKIEKNNINFYDYFEKDGELRSIDILKANSKNLEKEFEEKLNGNFYVGYLDKEANNLYIFAHNGTLGINGGALFYKLKENDSFYYYNSLINSKEKFKIIEKNILKKKDFIKEFTSGIETFKDNNSIYLITCYPNYSSTSRLILKMKKER